MSTVTLALFRSWLFAAVPALLALLAIVTVSTWHAADLHDDRPVSVAGIAQPAPADDDAGTMVHVAAHAIGHGIAMPILVCHKYSTCILCYQASWS